MIASAWNWSLAFRKVVYRKPTLILVSSDRLSKAFQSRTFGEVEAEKVGHLMTQLFEQILIQVIFSIDGLLDLEVLEHIQEHDLYPRHG